MKRKRPLRKRSTKGTNHNAKRGPRVHHLTASSDSEDAPHWLFDRLAEGFDALVDDTESGSDIEIEPIQEREKEIRQLGSFVFSQGMTTDRSDSLASYEDDNEENTVTVTVADDSGADDACHIM